MKWPIATSMPGYLPCLPDGDGMTWVRMRSVPRVVGQAHKTMMLCAGLLPPEQEKISLETGKPKGPDSSEEQAFNLGSRHLPGTSCTADLQVNVRSSRPHQYL